MTSKIHIDLSANIFVDELKCPLNFVHIPTIPARKTGWINIFTRQLVAINRIIIVAGK